MPILEQVKSSCNLIIILIFVVLGIDGAYFFVFSIRSHLSVCVDHKENGERTRILKSSWYKV